MFAKRDESTEKEPDLTLRIEECHVKMSSCVASVFTYIEFLVKL